MSNKKTFIILFSIVFTLYFLFKYLGKPEKIFIPGYLEEKKFLYSCRNENIINDTFNNITISPNPKISISMPVYNAEKFVIYALRSIQYQTFADFEIIVVEDKSTDNTLKVLEKEAEKDKRIKIIKNIKNSGVLFGKVNGILHSKGKYVLQLDADDAFCNKNSLKILYETAEKNNVDIVHFRIAEGTIDNLRYELFCRPKEFNKIIEQPYLKHYLVNKKITLNFWNKFYKRDVLIKALNLLGKERYTKYMVGGDDILLTVAVFNSAKNYIAINDTLHFYNFGNPSAITRNKNEEVTFKNIISFFTATDGIYQISLDHKPEFLYWIDYFPEFVNKKIGLETFKNNSDYYNRAKRFCKLYSENSYLTFFLKRKIRKTCNAILSDKKYKDF